MFTSRYYNNYFEHEKYPFSDFYHTENPIPWIYEELGIIKDWEISLTRLLTKLAHCETEDCYKIESQLNTLLDKLINFEKLISDAISNLKFAMENSESLVLSGFGKMNDFIIFVGDFINRINPIMKNIFSEVEDRLEKIEDNIEKNANNITELFSELEEIYNLLMQSLNDNYSYTILTRGSDYTIEFFNDFYERGLEQHPNDGGEECRVVRSLSEFKLNGESRFQVRYGFQTGTNSDSDGTFHYYSLGNRHVFNPSVDNNTNAPTFRHSYNIALMPTSWIVAIVITDNYFGDTNKTILSTSYPSDNTIWNASSGGSWGCRKNFSRGTIQNGSFVSGGRGLVSSMVQIPDGYNNQYYASPYTNGFTLINLNNATYADFVLK